MLRLIEWKRREADESRVKEVIEKVTSFQKNQHITFAGWHARTLKIEKVSSGRFAISVEISARLLGKGTITDMSRIFETWVVDREQGLQFEHRTGQKGGPLFVD